ncbi:MULTISPECIES: ferrous iron transport protein B [Caproicibacterium]|uniref:Ferrous iron transport protein B n=1 Tax=Caproicibacterium argilliputei TaxID=3030016 RepID=A0AA97H1W9_9FIRM|nr:ferrous iron transport protein B [Caproicibacterium argilliputei]WOC32926.1 ferrous iron transport protein B [Caproicibacterium argilliputei]
MAITIALAGNPNCGKTTLFNDLTGSSQYVGNWPGVTVEKKEGRLKGHKDVIIQDLPGIYSLSPYTLEEVVTRNYLVNEKPDVILNIIDGTNIERNLYLTTQLLELGIPVLIAVNMMDLVQKSGDLIDTQKLGAELHCRVVEISALKGKGGMEAAEQAASLAASTVQPGDRPHVFEGSVEHAIAHVEESIQAKVDLKNLRWYAIKLFERDEKVQEELNLDEALKAHLEAHIAECEKEMEDDAESIITNQRYAYIKGVINKAVRKRAKKGSLTTSDKIDRIVTNRILALPIFAGIIWLMYYISVTTVGDVATSFMNDTLFGAVIPDAVTGWLTSVNAAPWLQSLLVDGIIGGVGTVLGFVPQMLLIFFFLSVLEDSGYMARVAFIMDRIFRRFGLSGKSFIPMLIGSGCGVPAIMATRTIENEKDRRMTIMLAPFIPCTAKTVIIGMITVTFFPHSSFIAPAMYLLGIVIIVLSGIAMKKTKYFGGDPAPFVMELPAYHIPSFKGVLIHMWERARAFIIKAGTIIFVACVVIWLLSKFSWNMQFLDDQIDQSILASIGGAVSWFFAPLGFGNWKGAVAVISAEMAKEQAIGTLAVLNGVADGAADSAVSAGIATMFTAAGAFSFMVLNLFDPPCLVAMATTMREMGSRKWGWIAIGYQCAVGYALAFICYQFGVLFTGASFSVGTAFALAVIALIIYLVARKNKYKEHNTESVRAVSAAAGR